ncbi:hypothetical protein HYX08_03695 [Candidatus Woesearchaeota archaeon]|nr:hypothetical protein [Candidatus Woesearchaeota archaeon]
MVGNIPNFTKIDVLRCFLRLNKNIGRQELARSLELGEGTSRTMLEILKSKKLLDSAKKGHFLSKKGSDELAKLQSCISMPKRISLNSIYPGLKKVGVVIRGASGLGKLYRLRDIAVKNGAEGAIILKFEEKLYAPESDYMQDYRELELLFDLRKNDTVAIAFSGSGKNAETGALAIAMELSDVLKKFVEGL